MSDILVSIIESVADAAAAARARRQEALAKTAVRWQGADQEPPPVASRAPAQTTVAAPVIRRGDKAKPAAPAAAPEPPGERRIDVRQLFADPQSLIRTVVAAEILGPPLALRRQNLWDAPSV